MSQREGTVIMEYSVIKESELENLIDDVNRAIKEGWKLQGGISAVIYPRGGADWAQALVREAKWTT